MAGQRASAWRFADPTVRTLFTALLVFRLWARGFTNRDLRNPICDSHHHSASLRGVDPQSLTAGPMTDHLRRLRRHGLIARTPKSNRDQLTDSGWRTILFCTRIDNRWLRPGLAQIVPEHPLEDTPLRRQFDNLDDAIQHLLETQKFTAV